MLRTPPPAWRPGQLYDFSFLSNGPEAQAILKERGGEIIKRCHWKEPSPEARLMCLTPKAPRLRQVVRRPGLVHRVNYDDPLWHKPIDWSAYANDLEPGHYKLDATDFPEYRRGKAEVEFCVFDPPCSTFTLLVDLRRFLPLPEFHEQFGRLRLPTRAEAETALDEGLSMEGKTAGLTIPELLIQCFSMEDNGTPSKDLKERVLIIQRGSYRYLITQANYLLGVGRSILDKCRIPVLLAKEE